MKGKATNTICFVIPYYVTFATGGAEIQVHYLVNEFLRRGWQVELICGGRGQEDTIAESPYFDTRIRFHYYRFRKFRSLEFFGVMACLLRTRSKVYYQRTDFALSAACAFYCRLLKKVMIYALAQDTDALRGKYRSLMQQFTYRSHLKKCMRRIDFGMVDAMVNYAKQQANLLVCQNKEQEALLRTHFRRPAHIIQNSYPINKQEQALDKEKLVLWVGNMRAAKRPDLFLWLVDALQTRKGWHFVMIGAQGDDYAHLQHPSVEIMGPQPYETVNSLFAKAQFYVNTSELEGMPNTFIQSWMNKVLVLSLKVNPNGVFDHDRLGLCFKDDIQGMAAKLDEYLNGNNSSEICERAYAYAHQTFDVRRNVDKLTELIKPLLCE
ncbi:MULTISPECIES: glycosyltransferase family 4 protein [unclassified Carboxylicivirga]|uniref:glycosyltransferase family 4 protein n=1 Tax=Carboxylicivirga TaxID=1628153 RepID=UPI003D32B3B3